MKKIHDLAINPRKGRKKGKAVRIDLTLFYSVSFYLGLTKCTANGFVGSLFSDVFFGYLYIKKFVPSPFLGRCLKYFGSKFTDSRIPGLKGESLFYT
jgi:hypothetical protein